jgi:hypothetical protein
VADRGPDIDRYYIDRLRQRTFPTITQEDIVELKLIDPHRAWEAEPDFAVGAGWPFTRHQLRRTLALYAQRSGLVSLPSLKRQLQHITQEMEYTLALVTLICMMNQKLMKRKLVWWNATHTSHS